MKSTAFAQSPGKTQRFAGLLLAGGRSQRMGRDKAQLDWHGRPLGEHQAATLAATGASPLYLSCRADQPWTPPNFSRLEDRAVDGGVLAAFVGARAAMLADVVLVLAIDLPRVQPQWLADLAVRSHAAGISVVPFRDGGFEPLAAAWHRSALPTLRESLAHNRSLQQTCAALRERKLLQALPVAAGDAANLSNLNTPEDALRFGGTP